MRLDKLANWGIELKLFKYYSRVRQDEFRTPKHAIPNREWNLLDHYWIEAAGGVASGLQLLVSIAQF